MVVVKFESTGSAATCIDVMNGRFFAGRKLECSFWDGTDYTYRESKDEEKERADKFSAWLEGGSSSSEAEDSGDEDDEKDGKREEASKGSEKESEAGDAADSIHAGRAMPVSDGEQSDDEEEDEETPAADAIHAGRVMPDLDDSDDDEDD